MGAFDRVKLLIGEKNFDKLQNSCVAVFGIGGVGGYVAEALVRSGVGNIHIFDNDILAESNLNRQIIATVWDLGKDKTSVMKERLLSINPQVKVTENKVFYLPENANQFDFSSFDYVVDAVDTVTAKLEIIMRAKQANVPVISCMGTGGKLDPKLLKVDTIENTKGCPLARVMRRELKQRNIFGIKVVYSEESTKENQSENLVAEKKSSGRTAPSSMIFVPATAGLILANEVVKDILGQN